MIDDYNQYDETETIVPVPQNPEDEEPVPQTPPIVNGPTISPSTD